MYPLKHFFLGLIFSIILFLIFPNIGIIGSITILASSVLIDVDHYLYYIYKKKDFNLRNAYYWHIKNSKKFLALSLEKRKKTYSSYCFFHGIEILIILSLLGIFYNKYFLFVLIGFSFHLLLDLLYERLNFPMTNYGRISIIFDFFRISKMKSIEDSSVS
jgi:hypothetical protein